MIEWIPDFQEFQKLFSNDNSLKILALLSHKNQQLCAADIAKLLDIHISTAKKYLDLLCEFDFLQREYFPNKLGKPTYFRLSTQEIRIILDLPLIAQNSLKLELNTLPNPSIRETSDPESQRNYIVRDNLVEKIIVKKWTKAKRFVTQTINLSRNESIFLKYVPHPKMPAEHFIDICKKTKYTDFLILKELSIFVQKLLKNDIIEIKPDGEE